MSPTLTRRRLPLLGLALVALHGCTDRPLPTDPSPDAAPNTVTSSALVTTVTNTNDNGPGSLRAAILAAPPGGALIHFDPALGGQTITLTNQLVVFAGASVTIEGPAAKGVTLSGGGTTRIFGVEGELVLRNVTLTNGYAETWGGAIFSSGTVTLDHVAVTANTVGLLGGSLEDGGAIYSFGPNLTVINSTISGNRARNEGGGIYLYGSGATVTLINSTVADNASDGQGGGIVIAGGGALSIHNTIIANNTGTFPLEDCYFALIRDLTQTGTNLTSTLACDAGPATFVADPKLGPLAGNGGPTPTHALLPGSPAIDAASDCPAADDQRYVARPQGLRCDIGAFEFTDFPAVTLTIDPSGPVNPATGAAIVSGTITCPVAAPYQIKVGLTQNQKLGRLETVAHASETLFLLKCDGTQYWSIALAPPSGGFKNGTGSVTAKTSGPGDPAAPYVIPGAATAEVKLYWGRK